MLKPVAKLMNIIVDNEDILQDMDCNSKQYRICELKIRICTRLLKSINLNIPSHAT